MEEFILKAAGLFLAGMTGIVKAVPVGVAMGFTGFQTGLFVSLGSTVTVFILYFSGEPLKKWITKKWPKEKMDKKKGRFSVLLEKYGVTGVGLLTPGTLGPITSIIIGLIVLKDTSKLMPYLVAGIFLWSFLLSWLAVGGFELLKSLF
ncbi:MAG: hypothetical protein GXO47_11840 [Chlorobi bacterium]|nr:hypothetical protein [Chlorobiota bacterium]